MPVSPAIINDVKVFHDAFTQLEASLNERRQLPLTKEHIEETPLDRARLDIASLYVLNSAVWMKLCLRGEDPNENQDIKNEIERIKELSIRLKLLEDRQKAARIDNKAAGRFIKHALWEPTDKPESSSRQK